ncbi:MAG: hypothetical protein JWR11_4099 [Mycobacterium sp.]|nr:hypothetical protein [Mycobacterium sp.]
MGASGDDTRLSCRKNRCKPIRRSSEEDLKHHEEDDQVRRNNTGRCRNRWICLGAGRPSHPQHSASISLDCGQPGASACAVPNRSRSPRAVRRRCQPIRRRLPWDGPALLIRSGSRPGRLRARSMPPERMRNRCRGDSAMSTPRLRGGDTVASVRCHTPCGSPRLGQDISVSRGPSTAGSQSRQQIAASGYVGCTPAVATSPTIAATMTDESKS